MGNVSRRSSPLGDSPQRTLRNTKGRHKNNAPASAVAGGRARSARGPPSAHGEICAVLACCELGKFSPKKGADRLTDESLPSRPFNGEGRFQQGRAGALFPVSGVAQPFWLETFS